MKFNLSDKIIEFDEKEFTLKVGNKVIKPSIRTYGDMKDLYLDNNNSSDLSENKVMYFMFRGVYLTDKDKKFFEEDNNIRYDVTVVVSEIIGKEFNKTYGHYHPKNSNGKSYQELYQVLKGNAIFLQQNNNKAKFTRAFFGDKVVMEEGYGHVTINPSDTEILVMGNLVDNSFSSDYSEYKKLKGASYYYTVNGFIKNPNYDNKNIILEESEDFFDGLDLYSDFIKNPTKFEFLH